MKITDALKAWLVEAKGAKPDAGDDDLRKAAAEALVDGSLSAERYGELARDPAADEADALDAKMSRIADGLERLAERLAAKADDGQEAAADTKVKKAGNLDGAFRDAGDDDGDEVQVRVKEAAERYQTTKTALCYPKETKAGRPHQMAGRRVWDYDAKEGGRALDEPSERDKAVVGAFGKLLCAAAQKRSRTLAWMGLPDHDKELVQYAMHNMAWCGNSGQCDANYADIVNRKLTALERKALIDDSTSGGIEAVPLPFDDMIVATPILHGEFFPLVNVVPLDKGRRVQGAAAGIVTGSWGGVDATSISLFDTTSYVSAFDTTVFRWQGAIQIGLDYISDTPIDFAQFLTQQYGEVLLNNLDDVICTGNGTTQPEGIMTKSGTTSVAFGGTTTIGNYESLRFGVHKRELSGPAGSTAVFGGTDTSYQRAVSIPVGASDSRRIKNAVSMTNYDEYTWMGRPYKISDALTNAQVFFAVLGRYRMYRRRGLTVKTSTEGDTLIRANELLLAVTARFGGQLERGAAAAVTSTAEA